MKVAGIRLQDEECWIAGRRLQDAGRKRQEKDCRERVAGSNVHLRKRIAREGTQEHNCPTMIAEKDAERACR